MCLQMLLSAKKVSWTDEVEQSSSSSISDCISFWHLAQTFFFSAQSQHKTLYAFFTVFRLQDTQVLAFVNGLYFLYLIFHSITWEHRVQSPVMFKLLIIFCLVESWRSFRKAILFWCFGGPHFFTLPFWELISFTANILVCHQSSIFLTHLYKKKRVKEKEHKK